MKKNLRFYFALFFAKGTALVLKIIGRKGTSMPGSWAIILCPDFIGRIDKPKKIIITTGTNGKTTINNLIVGAMERLNYDFISNKEGTNVPTGIASCLIANSTFFGRQKKQLAIFELDERSSLRIFPYLTPDFILVSNLFRDSYRRNAHVEYIFDILNNNIPKETHLIINGDDPLCSKLSPQNNKSYFGIRPQSFESGEFNNIVRDGAFCPSCSSPLTYDFTRYHHIGVFHCENCSYVFPEKDYEILNADLQNRRLRVKLIDKEIDVKMLDTNPINMYNQLCAISVLHKLGADEKKIVQAMEQLQIAQSRLISTTASGKNIYRIVAKGQNPIACSRAFEISRNIQGKKCVILYLDDHFDALKSVENIAWYYDTDFEFLKDENINQIVVQGAREADVYVRLLMAGISPDIIKHFDEKENITQKIDLSISDSFVIYHDIYTLHEGEEIRKSIENRLKGET